MYRPSSRERRDQRRRPAARRTRAAGAWRSRCRTPRAPARGRASGARRPPGRRACSAAQAMPSSTVSACARSGATSMSTTPSGRPPIARTSDTLVTTAAAPAPNGSASRNGGEIASPQTTRYPSPCAIERGVVAVDARAEPLDDRAASRLASRPGRVADGLGECVQIRHRRPLNQRGGARDRRRAHPRRGRQRSACPRSPTRCATRARPSVEVDWRPPAGGDADAVRTLTGAVGAARRGDRGRQRARRRGDRGAPARRPSPSRPRARSCPGWTTGCCCTPGRRSRGSGSATRSAARWSPPRCSRAGPPTATRPRRCSRAARSRSRSGQRARPRRADDRRLLAVDARLGRRGRDVGRARLLDAQRGARRGRCGSASATTSRSSGCASSATTSGRGWRACSTHRGPIDVFGLAAQGLNMGDELHMRSQATGNLLIRDLAPALAVVGGEEAAPLPRRQPPLLPEPDDGGGQVRVAGRRGLHRVERRLADLAQRHRRRHPARGPARAAGSSREARRGRRRAAARGLRPGRRGARHRRLGRDRVRRPRRHGARRRARRGGLLRRRRGRRGGADRADGRRSAPRARSASRSRRATTPARRSGSTPGSWSSSASRRRSPPASCTRTPAPARSAPAWRTSPVEPFRAAIAALAERSLDDG